LSDPTLALPFDQYQRYRLVADILGDVRGESGPLDVLDVGGRTALLRRFLPEDRVVLVDVEASEEPGLVLGDGSRLPFASGAVDAVVAFDTLEHVPPARRPAFLAECRRVARRWVVVAGPYATEGVARAEALLTSFLREKMRMEHRYLAEHERNGLPLLAQTEEALGDERARVVSIGHANLERWLALMCLELYLDRDAPLRQIAARYFEFYNASLYASDHAAPVYRHAVVAAYGGAPLPSAERLLAAPVAPAGAFDSVQNLLQELLAFDVERDVIQPEFERLERVNGDLLLDLEGHKDTLMILQEINVEQKQVIAELRQRTIDIVGDEDALLGEVEFLKETLDSERGERDEVVAALAQDLEGHRRVVTSKSEELERLTKAARRLEATLAFERGEQAAVIGTLTQDLAGHREVVAAQREQVERLGLELAAFEANQVALEQSLGHERGRVSELEDRTQQLSEQVARLVSEVAQRDGTVGELVATRARLEAQLDGLNVCLGEKQAALDLVRGELTHERQVIDGLRAELRDRWRNLLRALGLK
jgi:SAM-dependent methyltransferase